jgi:hypothetical protein
MQIEQVLVNTGGDALNGCLFKQLRRGNWPVIPVNPDQRLVTHQLLVGWAENGLIHRLEIMMLYKSGTFTSYLASMICKA